MKTIVLLFNAFRQGGSQTYASELALQLVAKGYRIEVVAKNGIAKEIFDHKHIKVKTINWYENANEASDSILILVKKVISFFLLLPLIIRFQIRKPTLIIASQPWPIFYATILAPKSIPIIPLIHGYTNVEFPPIQFPKIRHRLSTPLCVSAETHDWLRKEFGLESLVMGNLFSARRYWGSDEIYKKPRRPIQNLIVIVSTLTSNKISVINRTLALLVREKSLKLRIVGMGEELPRIQARVKSLKLDNRVEIVNAGMNPRPHFEIAHLVIAVGRTALEAASRGVPVLIASDNKLFGILNSNNFAIAQEANFTARAKGSKMLTQKNFIETIRSGLNFAESDELIQIGKLAGNVGNIEQLDLILNEIA